MPKQRMGRSFCQLLSPSVNTSLGAPCLGSQPAQPTGKNTFLGKHHSPKQPAKCVSSSNTARTPPRPQQPCSWRELVLLSIAEQLCSFRTAQLPTQQSVHPSGSPLGETETWPIARSSPLQLPQTQHRPPEGSGTFRGGGRRTQLCLGAQLCTVLRSPRLNYHLHRSFPANRINNKLAAETLFL